MRYHDVELNIIECIYKPSYGFEWFKSLSQIIWIVI